MITSTQNPRIKHLLLLQQKSAQRRADGLFVVEGRREVEHCLAAGFRLRTVFVCEAISPPPNLPQQPPLSPPKEGGTVAASHPSFGGFGDGSFSPPLEGTGEAVEVVAVSPNVYERIAYRGGTEGIVAVVEARQTALSELKLSPSPLIVVLESVEKPGNLGAVLRSADAAGADAVVVCDPLTDLYNPNLIRSAVGALFTVPCVACSTEDCIAFFKERGIQILTAQLQDSRLYYDTPMTGPTAIVMGTEATGLTEQWRKAADAHIRIPMLGRLDSLNVSVSAAILLFEAVRQRQTGFKA
ncbi:MAG: RNA methyltransferase [Bacteroidaceae bacterium]|nr:RNA methyltransferase [Bacteroidaceae bacterium]